MTISTGVGVVNHAAGVVMVQAADGSRRHIIISHIMAGQTGFGAPVGRSCCAVGNSCVTIAIIADLFSIATADTTGMTKSAVIIMDINHHIGSGMAGCTSCILTEICRMAAMGIWSLFDRMAGDTGYTAAGGNSAFHQCFNRRIRITGLIGGI